MIRNGNAVVEICVVLIKRVDDKPVSFANLAQAIDRRVILSGQANDGKLARFTFLQMLAICAG